MEAKYGYRYGVYYTSSHFHPPYPAFVVKEIVQAYYMNFSHIYLRVVMWNCYLLLLDLKTICQNTINRRILFQSLN